MEFKYAFYVKKFKFDLKIKHKFELEIEFKIEFNFKLAALHSALRAELILS